MKTMRKKSWKKSTLLEDEETKFARLKFEEILHTLTTSTKENIKDRKRERAADGAEKTSSKNKG